MRTYSHPVLAALRFLQECGLPESTDGLKPAPFQSIDEAVAVLQRHSGKDFGPDIASWREWFRRNRRSMEPIDLIESAEPAAPPPPHAPPKPVDQSITDTWVQSSATPPPHVPLKPVEPSITDTWVDADRRD
jgi:hypothetical protein